MPSVSQPRASRTGAISLRLGWRLESLFRYAGLIRINLANRPSGTEFSHGLTKFCTSTFNGNRPSGGLVVEGDTFGQVNPPHPFAVSGGYGIRIAERYAEEQLQI